MARTLVAVSVLTILCAGAALGAGGTAPTPAIYEMNAGGVQSFLKCTQVGSQTEVIDFTSGGGGPVSHVPGKTTYIMNCSRVLTSDKSFATWRHDVEIGASGFRKSGTLTLLDLAFTPIATFNFTNAWPSSLFVNSADNGSSGLTVTEEMTFAVDAITRP